MTSLNTDVLDASWAALRDDGKSGWRAIELWRGKHNMVLAGRGGDDNNEALLIGISSAPMADVTALPRSQGFSLSRLSQSFDHEGLTWFALCRGGSGSVALFSLMSMDLMGAIEAIDGQSGARSYSELISRIKAWQEFMKRDGPGVLSREEEVGLVGELVALRDMLASGLPIGDALAGWIGPEGGLHDFAIGVGSVEVKASLTAGPFIAKIGNLDQLDDSSSKPLFVAAIRLVLDPNGWSLPEFIENTRASIDGSGMELLFEARVLAAGYAHGLRDQYLRKYRPIEISYRLVDADSPRLVRSMVPPAVREVSYSVDLDAYPMTSTTFNDIKNTFWGS